MIILIGKSASGKTDISKKLNELYGILKVVTYTTRDPRLNEINKVDYNFVNKEEFKQLQDNDFFVETTFYNDNYYGSAKKDILDNKCIILDPNGLNSFLALNDNHIVSFYLKVDKNIRYQRMIKRNDEIDKIKQRITNDELDFKDELENKVNYVIDANFKTIENLAKDIYKLYKEHLEKL